SFHVFIRPLDQAFSLPYDSAGLQELVARLRSVKPTLIVLEASGGYEKVLVAELAAAELPVVVVNPRQVREFAKARGILAKNDSLDAKVLAHFADSIRPEIRPIPNAQAEELSDLL